MAVPANAAAPPAQAPAAAAGASATTAAPKPAQLDPASLALAHQILTLAFPPEKRSQMYASVMHSIVEQNRKAMEAMMPAGGDKDFLAILDRSTGRMFEMMTVTMDASIPDYFESFARAYARDFSPDDLRAILAFVQTPAGRHYFERAPDLIKDPDVQAASQRMMAKLIAKMPEITRESMQDVEDYVAKKKGQEKPANPTT
jgi:hypothetical protein